MAINFSTVVYLQCFDMFARSVTVIPLASQPGAPSYYARGIFDTRPINVMAEDGSIFCEQQTILDVRDAEFGIVPTQLDQIQIPVNPDDVSNITLYEVTHTESNGGGETTLAIRKVLTANPPYVSAPA